MHSRQRGFTLLELLLALTLGLLFAAVMLRALALEGPQATLLARHLRERGVQSRTLELLRADLLRAETLRLGTSPQAACPLSGRQPLLEIGTPQGAITWSQGAAPSAIWRGRVLMRCGPAFGLDGEPSGGAAQNRVVIDALSTEGLRLERLATGLLRLRLQQEFRLAGGGSQRLTSSRALGIGALVMP